MSELDRQAKEAKALSNGPVQTTLSNGGPDDQSTPDAGGAKEVAILEKKLEDLKSKNDVRRKTVCRGLQVGKMQNRNAMDKLNQQCSKLALLSYHNCVANNAYLLQEIAECLQQNAKSEKATAFLIWKALLFSVVALTTISEHLHHRIYFTVANILQSPVHC